MVIDKGDWQYTVMHAVTSTLSDQQELVAALLMNSCSPSTPPRLFAA
jgi:hypothetical protein